MKITDLKAYPLKTRTGLVRVSTDDIALWDFKGKVCGQPLYRLLGGAVRTTFTMYKSIGGGAGMAPEEMREHVREA